MRFAILGDVHGNLEALEAVLADIEGQSVDEIDFLGDVVGYGAHPAECLDRVLETARVCVAGNHDWAVVGKTAFERFNKYSKQTIIWTADRIDFREKKALASWPLTAKIDDIFLVHASPLSPESWHYIRDKTGIGAQFDAFDGRICFIGHTHVPAVWASDDSVTDIAPNMALALDVGVRHIVNIGSVGQPRDRDPRACYVVFDEADYSVTFRRVKYDIASAAKAITDAGLPEYLAERLFLGK